MKITGKKSKKELYEYPFIICMSLIIIWLGICLYSEHPIYSTVVIIFGIGLLVFIVYVLIDYLKYPQFTIYVDEYNKLHLPIYNIAIPIKQIKRIACCKPQGLKQFVFKDTYRVLVVFAENKKYVINYVGNCDELVRYIKTLKKT